MVTLGACSRLESLFVDEPIAAGIDSPDKDVAEYLQAMLQSAQAMTKSGLVRGRLGMAYDVNGLRDAALATYEQAEVLDPNDFRWPYFSAQLIAETGEHEQALETLARALAIDADYAPAWLWRGTWLLEVGLLDEAMIAFQQALDLEAGPVATFGRAQVLVARGSTPASGRVTRISGPYNESPLYLSNTWRDFTGIGSNRGSPYSHGPGQRCFTAEMDR